MTKRMLIDATHPEETRVVVVDGNRLDDFDYETASRKQLKGNIYLAKITRVEPSLQAAFVEYGGNRHGFLPFNEIHPDYYRIPIADRQALLAEEAAYDRRRAEDAEVEANAAETGEPALPLAAARGPSLVERIEPAAPGEASAEPAADEYRAGEDRTEEDRTEEDWAGEEPAPGAEAVAESGAETDAEGSADQGLGAIAEPGAEPRTAEIAVISSPVDPVETVGGDEAEDDRSRRMALARRYKIQDVIKRRQIILIQVTKEERGNKGAALTTYLSLAGRYCVLMPNTARGGGISRKIGSAADRKRLKGILDDFELPEGMAIIVRTAGAERSKPELKRDYEYLLRLWDEIRELTLKSTAPALIYEEADLIKRSIRDLYSRDIEEVVIEGDVGYKTAKAFMRALVPSHAKRVQSYKDPTIPLFHRYQVDSQIEAMHSPTVTLRSGGYIVINATEALVAIDVNSGRATRERNIEETALKTNVEAAEEVARQLRLRDLAGLIVIDFIDMEEQRHNAQVERRLKDALRLDRARIQIGRISHFGLLEMSRQRLRPSFFESSTVLCRYCHGTGHGRSVDSSALHVLRLLEEDGIRRRSAAITLTVPTAVALYIANNKRQSLIEIEARHHLLIALAADDTLVAPECRIERTKTLLPGEGVQLPVSSTGATPDVEDDEPEIAEDEAEDETEVEAEAEAEPEEPTRTARSVPADDGEPRDGPRRRRRRRRRGEDRGSQPQPIQPSAEQQVRQPTAAPVGEATPAPASEEQPGEQPREGGRRRRRGRRGGRRRSGRGPEQGAATPLASDEQPQGLAESEDRQPEPHAERPAPLEIERPMVVTPPSPMPPSPMPETPSAPAVVVTGTGAGTGDEPGAETAERPARVGWWRRKQS